MQDSIKYGPWMSRPKHYFLRIFNIHWPIASLFYGVWWKTQCGIICQWLLFSTLSRLKQVHCFRNASFIATWKHLASEAVLSTQPSLKWSLIKSNRSSCKGSISWFLKSWLFLMCYHPWPDVWDLVWILHSFCVCI